VLVPRRVSPNLRAVPSRIANGEEGVQETRDEEDARKGCAMRSTRGRAQEEKFFSWELQKEKELQGAR